MQVYRIIRVGSCACHLNRLDSLPSLHEFVDCIMNEQRKVIVYIASSADGYIARPNDDLSFLSLVAVPGEDYGYAKFKSSVDTVLMGRKTFDWVYNSIGSVPHPELTTYVITRTEREAIGSTHFYTGSVADLVRTLKTQPGKHIYCDGGAQLIHSLMQENLIDEYIISIVPTLLGGSVRLFRDGYQQQDLLLVSAKTYASGLVQVHYAKK